jgi:hypothetical protein
VFACVLRHERALNRDAALFGHLDSADRCHHPAAVAHCTEGESGNPKADHGTLFEMLSDDSVREGAYTESARRTLHPRPSDHPDLGHRPRTMCRGRLGRAAGPGADPRRYR